MLMSSGLEAVCIDQTKSCNKVSILMKVF